MVAKSIAYYFLPLSIIGVLYALMARRLHLSAREMPGELGAGPQRAQARARRHVARMVVTFVIGKCAFVCMHCMRFVCLFNLSYVSVHFLFSLTQLHVHVHFQANALFSIFSVYHLLSSVSCVYALVSFESKQ